jgi:hypothetical protein
VSDVITELANEANDKTMQIARLKAENARLREQVDAAHMSRLLTENENEKLRELCADMWGTMDLLDACGVDEYDEPLNCCTGCNQYGSVDEFAGGKRVIGCKLMYRMSELGVD